MDKVFDWFKDRLAERTSWDGLILVGVGAVVLLLPGLVKLAAWAAIGWGAYTFWKAQD